ncbi:MAG: 3-deoxy-manno-octulosonate cytidylyltransferase [Thermoanaerobaculia bacterium]
MPPFSAHSETSPLPTPRIVAAIPARYGSTRLPAKPLATIAGKPLIEHVYRRVEPVPGLARTVVLTDDERIAEVVRAFGGDCQLTPADCASGTDRIAWAARSWDAEAVINVQGDWILDPEAVATLARHLIACPADPMATLAVPASPGDLDNPASVKVVCCLKGYALYFSRSAIPYRRAEGGPTTLKHWGIYGYRRDTLLALAALPQSPLERAESLEQLRALENGIKIRVLTIRGEALGVDTPEDLERARTALGNSG